MREVVLRSSSLDADGIAQLAAAHWPKLLSLDVSGNNLDSAAVARLAHGSWPVLEDLDVSSNKLDTAAISGLVKGAWPCLTMLRLSGPTVSDPAAPGGLEGANHWLMLETLDLICSRISSNAVFRMGQARWAHLRGLLICAGPAWMQQLWQH